MRRATSNGEHLGFFLTGAWSVLVGVAITQSAGPPVWLGIAGTTVGTVLALCSLEFVGPFSYSRAKSELSRAAMLTTSES